VTLTALAVHGRYSRLVTAVDDRLLEDRRLFVAFVLSLLVGPLALLFVPMAIG
jgi:sodium-dependent phosphate cotransporter